MKKTSVGILAGIIAGIIDVIPMIIMDLSWDANISAFLFWIVVGFIISIASINLKGWKKGLLITFLLELPIFVLVAWEDIASLYAMLPFTIIMGSLLGYSIDKWGK